MDKLHLEKRDLEKNLKAIHTEITSAAKRVPLIENSAARSSDQTAFHAHQNTAIGTSVKLIAVSKTKSATMVRWCHELGQQDFGENYVQEANQKQKDLSDLPIRWHFIGHLQKNKVKFVVGQFDLIHSVDSLALAQKISQKAAELKIRQKILLEVNLGDESTKGGFSKAELPLILTDLLQLENLEIAGLMALPPLNDNPELTRPFFRELRLIFESLKTKLNPEQQQCWQFLSMGTTGDFAVAIEEGANMVRVGTAIFGERNT